jgi:putative membrane-bound dehydrogenase-like protein
MKRLALLCLFPAVVAFAWAPGAKEPAVKTHEVKLNGHTFTLPVGFEIELIAGPPLVDRPIVADFDEQGRLYVADSSGTNDKVEVQLREKPHRIVRLEDTDGDGKFDKRTVFADKMMFPEGTMWHAGSLYVAAPPSIWKLTDTDGDGVADERVEWFKGKTLTGCANDLHGPYLGPDGWIYWAKGAFARQTYERPGRKPFETRAAHLFRCRPDGTGIEPVMTGGMDNPVDVVFTPGGERIFTTTFLQTPGGGFRDGLIHAIYGGVYGKDHDPVYEHKWTSPSLMPVLTHMGPAAPCGLTRYESSAFGPEYKDNLFACQFNMHKVSRHILTPDGATFKTRDEDFLVSDNLDFHPTDVLEDADGSLLVIDTGGWYKLCCPSSQLHKPDVLGGIYRVRKTGAARIDDPRGRKLAWDTLSAKELVPLLEDARPAVKWRAVQALADKGQESVGVLAEVVGAARVRSAEIRLNAVWALTRIDHPAGRGAARTALTDPDETVRQAAIHSAGVWRDRGAGPALVGLLRGPSLHNRRAAAEALGRIGDRAAVPALLRAVGEPADRVLEHSLTYALIEIADRERTAAGLTSPNARTRRAALVALDQMDDGGLEAKAVAAELASPDPAMKETAWWIASRHPEWGGALAGFLRERLAAKDLPATEQDELSRQLAKFARATPTQKLLADLLNDPSASREAHRVVLRAMAQAGLRQAPDAWVAAIVQVLSGDDAERVREAVATARTLNISREKEKAKAERMTVALLKIADDEKTAVPVRLTALAAVPGGLTDVKPPLFTLLRTHLDREEPVATRALAVDVLSRAKLNAEQLLALTEVLKTVGPIEVNRLLDAFAECKDDAVGERLVTALKESPARSNLRAESIKARLAKFGLNVQKQAEELYAALNADAAKQQARLEELLASLKAGDVRRGQLVFNSTKAACSTCHAIGYKGGKVGPDLTRIGSIRTERDLLESIVFPSASFVRSYEPMLVTTKSGKTHNGLVRKDTSEEIVLVTGADQEVRIARDDIDEMAPSKTSIMPAGLDQQLTVQELADLVAFLRACK